MTLPFVPDGCDTEVSPDGRYVRVTFNRNDGQKTRLEIPKTQYAHYVDVLERQAAKMNGAAGRAHALNKTPARACC